MNKRTKSRVMVIGLDGATLDLIQPWAAAGHLPVFAQLMNEGGYGRLRSVNPVISSAAWATFMTGTNPGKHGVFDFVYRQPDCYRLKPVTNKHITQPTLWRLLSHYGKRVIVLNVPMTYPPEAVNGILVSGLGTPYLEKFTYPAELAERLLRKGYQVNRRIFYPANAEKAFLEESYERIAINTSVFISMLQEEEWDFSMIVYRETDEVPHGFWHYMDESHPRHKNHPAYSEAILNLYKKMDQCIGELSSAAGENTTLFIVSDHGSGPLYRDVFINEWLRQKGFLTTKKPKFHRRLLSQLGITRENVSRFLRRYHLGSLERLIKAFLKDQIRLIPMSGWADFHEGIDWNRTRAYSFGYQGQIFINLSGREPNGIVRPGKEYERVCEEIVGELKLLQDPDDGLPIVDRIYRKEELFYGPHLMQAPDLVLSMRALSYTTRLGFEFGNKPGEIISDSRVHLSGGHRLDGVLIASGPSIQRDLGEMAPAWLGDVTPTLLQIFGYPLPDWMDGQILSHWLSPHLVDREEATFSGVDSSPPLGSSGLTEAEEVIIMKRLSELGYVD